MADLKLTGKLLLGVLLVLIGGGLIFGGFELAAYEQTIADREVTDDGTVLETEVWQLPDGNWTYRVEYEYRIDQEEAITSQGLEGLYPSEMADEQTHTSAKRGGKYDTESQARDTMEDHIREDGSVLVYIDPFYPQESASLSDATTQRPRILQYAGSLVVLLGIVGLARMARRVSA